ncbi:MAG TPA: cytochrome P450 [Halococcus sp.]|nr:cytochrome P450 [Halococcus sp.]
MATQQNATTQTKTAPGPWIRSLFTFGPELLRRDPVDVAVDLREHYGHVVRIPPIYPGLDRPAYVVTHPDDVQYILQTHHNEFDGLGIQGSADFAAAVEGSILGPPENDDPEWWKQRLRQLAPEFNEHAAVGGVRALARETSTTLAEYANEQSDAAQPATLKRVFGNRPDPAAVLANTGEIRLLPLASRLSIRLIGVSLFGPDVRAHEAAVIRAVARLRRAFKRRTFGVVTGAISRRLPDWVSSSFSTPLRVLRGGTTKPPDPLGTLHEVADAMVARRERAPWIFDDAVTTWLTRPDSVTGATLTPKNARDEIVGLLIAGFATVSAALTWAIYLVATHPEIQNRMYEETRSSRLFGPLSTASTDSVWTPTHTELRAEFSLIHRVFQEVLRLYPTLPVFGRSACEGVSLGGYAIEDGAPVFVSPYVTHRDPEFWENPTKFDPDRFLPSRSRDRPEFAYYPFSAGPNGCLGREIATTEAVVALATLFREYRVELTDNGSVGMDSAINLQPDRDIHVRLFPRSP